MLRQHRWQLLVTMILLCIISGCVKKESTGNLVVCTYEWWVGLVAVLAGMAASAWGWVSRRNGFRGWLFLVVAVAGTVLFAPYAFFDHVTVSEQSLETRWGFWCFPTRHSVAFSDVTSAQLVKRESRGRRGRRKTSYYLEFLMKDGRTEELSATNDLMEEAAEDLMTQLASHGIQVMDMTGE